MAVVKAQYFNQCLERGEPFQDRKQIPKEFIFSGREVITNWKRYGHKFLVIFSYGWLSKQHPDPELYHLKRLVYVLDKLHEFYFRKSKRESATEVQTRNRRGGPPPTSTPRREPVDIGVILDFCSLWQNRSTVDGEDSRTEKEKAQFGEGLKCINTPYAHQEVTAIKLMETPEAEKRGYDDRGWTLFESKLIDGKASGVIADNHMNAVSTSITMLVNGHLNVLALDKEIDTKLSVDDFIKSGLRTGLRSPPTTPARFEEELEERQKRADGKGVNLFTSGKDQPFVIKKYQNSYAELTRSIFLEFNECGWIDKHVEDLLVSLPDFTNLGTISLARNSIGNGGATAFAKYLETNGGTAGGLETVTLQGNQIGDEGAIALAKAVARHKSLADFSLARNHIGDRGAIALAKALQTNRSIEEMDLSHNKIGDKGAKALAQALETNKKIMFLTTTGNNIGDEGKAALKKHASHDA